MPVEHIAQRLELRSPRDTRLDAPCVWPSSSFPSIVEQRDVARAAVDPAPVGTDRDRAIDRAADGSVRSFTVRTLPADDAWNRRAPVPKASNPVTLLAESVAS